MVFFLTLLSYTNSQEVIYKSPSEQETYKIHQLVSAMGEFSGDWASAPSALYFPGFSANHQDRRVKATGLPFPYLFAY
jgi:hypothetical protein